MAKPQRNVLGQVLTPCSTSPMTGFYRTGCCETGDDDTGKHTVCVLLTEEFLQFSKAAGNDLSTPRPDWGFAGLKAGDQWCLCADRWKQALDADCAPQVILEATHHNVLQIVSMEELHAHALHTPGPVN